jgi:hypothetical protein
MLTQLYEAIAPLNGDAIIKLQPHIDALAKQLALLTLEPVSGWLDYMLGQGAVNQAALWAIAGREEWELAHT